MDDAPSRSTADPAACYRYCGVAHTGCFVPGSVAAPYRLREATPQDEWARAAVRVALATRSASVAHDERVVLLVAARIPRHRGLNLCLELCISRRHGFGEKQPCE